MDGEVEDSSLFTFDRGIILKDGRVITCFHDSRVILLVESHALTYTCLQKSQALETTTCAVSSSRRRSSDDHDHDHVEVIRQDNEVYTLTRGLSLYARSKIKEWLLETLCFRHSYINGWNVATTPLVDLRAMSFALPSSLSTSSTPSPHAHISHLPRLLRWPLLA